MAEEQVVFSIASQDKDALVKDDYHRKLHSLFYWFILSSLEGITSWNGVDFV